MQIFFLFALLMLKFPFRMAAMIHVKARTLEYLGGPKRFPVPDDKVPWSAPWDEYDPTDYTAPVLKGASWADPDIRCTN